MSLEFIAYFAFYSEILTKINFFDRVVFKCRFFEEIETKIYPFYFKKKVEVFYKHKTVKIFQFFEKIHRFVGDALVTGTKF